MQFEEKKSDIWWLLCFVFLWLLVKFISFPCLLSSWVSSVKLCLPVFQKLIHIMKIRQFVGILYVLKKVTFYFSDGLQKLFLCHSSDFWLRNTFCHKNIISLLCKSPFLSHSFCFQVWAVRFLPSQNYFLTNTLLKFLLTYLKFSFLHLNNN